VKGRDRGRQLRSFRLTGGNGQAGEKDGDNPFGGSHVA